MLFLLQNPHVLGLSIAVMTAVLVYVYTRTIEPDPEKQLKTLWKVLAAGLVSALVLSWLATRSEPIASEPFMES